MDRVLADLLACSRESLAGSSLARFLPGDAARGLDQIRGPEGRGATEEVGNRLFTP